MNSRFPQPRDPRIWLIVAILALSTGLTIAGYAFKVSLDLTPAGIQFQLEGNPRHQSLPPAPLLDRK
ncbi:hypothetical protein [Leptolyngbya sp. FACHB-17]|uniref:hypothetical protein n=1 Tax=unclassified Leptolyngbya TaxID=2650499 RepID=UPI001680D8A1|nr:hypothetical protein [Leptolyngbya sp. FACHB-17]MBD2078464.1 hypothetical protein [Leptolyngbya sp. FACHB-17]